MQGLKVKNVGLLAVSGIEDKQIGQHRELLEILMGRPVSEESVRTWLYGAVCCRNRITLWLLTNANDVVGTANASLIDLVEPRIRIDDVIIHPRYQHVGHGNRLLKDLFGLIDQAGYDWKKAGIIELTSHPIRKLENFYLRLGFQRYDTNVYILRR